MIIYMECTLLIIINQMGLKTEEQIVPYLDANYIEKFTKEGQIYFIQK